jgi:hypothetical protein
VSCPIGCMRLHPARVPGNATTAAAPLARAATTAHSHAARCCRRGKPLSQVIAECEARWFLTDLKVRRRGGGWALRAHSAARPWCPAAHGRLA